MEHYNKICHVICNAMQLTALRELLEHFTCTVGITNKLLWTFRMRELIIIQQISTTNCVVTCRIFVFVTQLWEIRLVNTDTLLEEFDSARHELMDLQKG